MTFSAAIRELKTSAPDPTRIVALAILDAYREANVPLPYQASSDWYSTGGRYWRQVWTVCGYHKRGDKFLGAQSIMWAELLPTAEADALWRDLAELAACLERPVQVWNETLEFVPRRYTTTNFMYRSKWLDGVVAYLHLLAAHNYDRNMQEYTAGGTAMRDKAKGNLYLQKGQMMLQEYKDWVKQRKGQINLEGAFGSTSESF